MVNCRHKRIGPTFDAFDVGENGYSLTPMAARVLLPQFQLERAVAHSSFFCQGLVGGGTGVPRTMWASDWKTPTTKATAKKARTTARIGFDAANSSSVIVASIVIKLICSDGERVELLHQVIRVIYLVNEEKMLPPVCEDGIVFDVASSVEIPHC